MPKVFLFFILASLLLIGCSKDERSSKFENMTLFCHNNLDAPQYHTVLIFHDNKLEVDDDYGGNGNASVSLNDITFSDSSISLIFDSDYSKSNNETKKIHEEWNINRYTGRYNSIQKYTYKDGVVKEYTHNGDCLKKETVKSF